MLKDCSPQKVDAEDAHLAVGWFVGVRRSAPLSSLSPTGCGVILNIGLLGFLRYLR